jgi:tRNA pseudouridine38-40 synthase
MIDDTKYVLQLSYNGASYHGWQIQKNALSVQQVLNECLSTLIGQPVETTGGGRTDTGVHAYMQMAQIDSHIKISSPENFLYRLNKILPHQIAVHHIYTVPFDFSVRFDALFRRYEYHISFIKNVFGHQQNLTIYRPNFDINLMNQACEILLNHTDFQSFSKYHTDVNHYTCHIDFAYWQPVRNGLIFHIKANRFLRGMVRAIVGTMLKVGKRGISLSEFEAIILSKDRINAGAAVSPYGLYLAEIGYDDRLKKLI